MSGSRYLQYSPARAASPSPHLGAFSRSTSDQDNPNRYLAELLEERQKLNPFAQVLPICSRLLDQEIYRVSSIAPKWGFGDHDRVERGSPLPSSSLNTNSSGLDLGRWGGLHPERLSQPNSMDWHGSPGVAMSPVVIKKVLRMDIPVDRFPNFNFVGRLLGPRGHSLKRVEAMTDCRVYIRGRGSVKDFAKEEQLRDKPGYEHLNEPLHVLIEAEHPPHLIDAKLNHARQIIENLLEPVDESHDHIKRDQLRELALLNGTLREDSPGISGSISPFGNSAMKRAKTGI